MIRIEIEIERGILWLTYSGVTKEEGVIRDGEWNISVSYSSTESNFPEWTIFWYFTIKSRCLTLKLQANVRREEASVNVGKVLLNISLKSSSLFIFNNWVSTVENIASPTLYNTVLPSYNKLSIILSTVCDREGEVGKENHSKEIYKKIFVIFSIQLLLLIKSMMIITW